MSFNRRGDRDRRPDRERSEGRNRPEGRPTGEWQPRERGYQPRGDRPFTPRGDRPFTPRPRFDRPPATDEGGMSIRLDPRRLAVLKRLAADAGLRPGDLVLRWTEERLDAERAGEGSGAGSLAEQVAALAARIDALEAGRAAITTAPAPTRAPTPADGSTPAVAASETESEAAPAVAPKRARRRASASRAGDGRVALHDEMIAVLVERGPMSAADLAAAVAERGRYAPPRSGKPIDAAMISQRVSNPTYRARFVRREGRIGLAE